MCLHESGLYVSSVIIFVSYPHASVFKYWQWVVNCNVLTSKLGIFLYFHWRKLLSMLKENFLGIHYSSFPLVWRLDMIWCLYKLNYTGTCANDNILCFEEFFKFFVNILVHYHRIILFKRLSNVHAYLFFIPKLVFV